MVPFVRPSDVEAITPLNPYPRWEDGRPRVPDELLERMKSVTVEEAWTVLLERGYPNQYVGGWRILHPDRVLVGRALTAQFVPLRPDLNDVIQKRGDSQGHVGTQNNWVIQSVREGDVVVADVFGKIEYGTLIGDNLAAAVLARGGTGLVIEGGIRDKVRVAQTPKINVFYRDDHPSPIRNVSLLGFNTVVRIGQATVLPGDVVLGTPSGVIFIPPHLVEDVVRASEETRLRDQFAKQRLKEGKYTSGQVDRADWEPYIEEDYAQWRKQLSEVGTP